MCIKGFSPLVGWKLPLHAHTLTSSMCIKDLAAHGSLATLTVDELKLYCAANGLIKGGKKADIIARITQHLDA